MDPGGPGRDLLTIDVEDWFHILDVPGTPSPEDWDRQPSRVERNLRDLLGILAEEGITSTCFFLGWVARRFPELVREAAAAGHEIASHGQEHRLIYRQDRPAFRREIQDARRRLEDLTGREVWGYRAPGFSVVPGTLWALEELAAAGYRYDSSVFPGRRGHGGLPGTPLSPYRMSTPAGEIIELPITLVPVLGRRLCLFGGGYLRLFPYPLIHRMARKVRRSGRPVLFDVHPREIDADQPRLDMGLRRRWKSYVGLQSTRPKLRRILRDFRPTSLREWLDEGGGAGLPLVNP